MILAVTLLAVIMPSTRTDFESFHWQGRLPPGQSIEISNVYGSIHAEASLDDRADVTTAQPGVQVTILENAGGLRFQVASTDASARTDFIVHVPRGVRFVGRTVNGSVEAAALRGDAAGYTVNGDVHIRATGEVRAKTVNGSIEAMVGQVHSRQLEFSAVNGAITLQLPRQLCATLHAHTSHGHIHSDLPLEVTGRRTDLRLITVNGNIRVRRI